MVKRSRDIESLIISDLFEELDEQERAELESALADDSSRKQELLDLKETMQMVSREKLVEEPPEEFWDNVWPEFQNRIMVEEKKKSWSVFQLFSLKGDTASLAWSNFWKPALQVGAVAAMLVVGIFIGRQFASPELKNNNLAPFQMTEIKERYEPELEQKRQDYIIKAADSSLERSEDLFNKFLKYDPELPQDTGKYVVVGREELFSIINEMAAMRENMNRTRQDNYADLFDDIEIMLGEIATLNSNANENNITLEVQDLQQGINELNLVGRIKQLRSGALRYERGANYYQNPDQR